jgi:homoprotocatechuate degradation regulator HpaR
MSKLPLPPEGLSVTNRTLSIQLLRAREAVMERFRPFLQESGVTEQQWRIMRVLRETGPCFATQLAEHACILAPSLSRILKTLETKGWVRMPKDAADGRKTRVELTDAGDAFLSALTPQSTAAFSDIEARLGRERIDRLLDDLNFLLVQLDTSTQAGDKATQTDKED